LEINVSVLIAIIGCALSVGTFFIGRVTSAKTTGKEDGELKSDIKYIRASVEKQEAKIEKVAGNYDDIRLEIQELKGKLSALEQKVKMLHGE
jgi:peptidoglycan hydrolase CwlO-like protein